MMRRLLCRLRGHDDALLEVAGSRATLWCTRCHRERQVHSVALPPEPPAAAAEVAQVDTGALELLRAGFAVNAALADTLARRLRDEGWP